MIIREYQRDDCKEIAELLYNTVHTVTMPSFAIDLSICKRANFSRDFLLLSNIFQASFIN